MPDNGNGPAGNGAGTIQAAEAADALDSTRWCHLNGGDIELTRIGVGSNNARYEVFLAGWSSGYSARQHEIDRLNWLVDLYYFLACNPKKTGADFYQHATSELWRQAVDA